MQFGLQFEMEEANQNDTAKDDAADADSGKIAVVAKDKPEPDNEDTKESGEDEAPAAEAKAGEGEEAEDGEEQGETEEVGA